jgi:UDP-glucose-4-epimerase GalE
MRVLATGGAGYVGSVVVSALAAAGHEVTVLDTLEHGRAERVPDARLVVGSVTDEALVTELLVTARIEAVLHFAAYKAAPESVAHPIRYHRNNVGGAIALLGAMERAGVRVLVQSSTCAVYGNPDRVPVDEDAPLRPLNPYAVGKGVIEALIGDMAAAGTVSPVVLRYFNAAGAVPPAGLGEDPGGDSLFCRLVDAAHDGTALSVFGTDYPTRDGTAVRDFVHVEDLAAAHVLALALAVSGGAPQTLNIGSGTGSTVLEALAAVERASGRRVAWEPARRRPGDPVESLADTGRARAVLGWSPARSLDEIAASAWTHRAAVG